MKYEIKPIETLREFHSLLWIHGSKEHRKDMVYMGRTEKCPKDIADRCEMPDSEFVMIKQRSINK